MLQVASPFPHVGSYALFVDDQLPIGEQRAELVRIMRRPTICERGGDVAVAFPLRSGARGSMLVDDAKLIDGSELSKAEERELADLLRYLAGRARPDKTKAARCEALRSRLIMSGVLRIELTKLAQAKARDARRAGGSIGSVLPEERAA